MVEDPRNILSDAIFEPPNGTVDNLGLVRIMDFFPTESPPKDALKDFTLFDASKKAKGLASHDSFVHNMQHTLDHKINVDHSSHPFTSARHDYFVQQNGLSNTTTNSQSRLLFSVTCGLKRDS